MATEVCLNPLPPRCPALFPGWRWSGLRRRRPLLFPPDTISTAAPPHASQSATSGSSQRRSLRLRLARRLLRPQAAAPARARGRLQGMRGRRSLPCATGALRSLRHTVATLARCGCEGRDDLGHLHARRAATFRGAAGRRGITTPADAAAVDCHSSCRLTRPDHDPAVAHRAWKFPAARFTTGQGRRCVGPLVALSSVVPRTRPVSDRLRE